MSEATRSVEARGKNVEDAIQKGLAQLGVRRDQVDISVITEGNRGILGIGAEDARVRLTVIPVAPPPPPRPVTPPPPPRPVEPPRPVPVYVDEDEEEEEAPPRVSSLAATSPLEDLAAQVVRDILVRMGIKATVTGRESPAEAGDQGPAYLVDIRGGDLNALTGRRAEGLDALQFLTRLIVQHKTGDWASIVVDADGYRERRSQALRRMAQQMADRVRSDGRSISLDPMPPFERRIIHLTLRDDPEVMTVSVGEGEGRKVTIRPKK